MAELSRLLAVVAVAGIVLAGCAARTAPERPNAVAKIETTQTEAATGEPTMTYGTRNWAPKECKDWVIVEHAFSGSDDTDLVGFADNVFVGRVEGRVGTSGPSPGSPWGNTRFSVGVLENVKGSLEGTVTVAQEGSRAPERGCLRLAEGDPLLEPGREVMFFTRHDGRRGWHQIVVPGYGDVPIDDRREREELVRRFESARRNQTDPLR